jgi:hypothetical protein
VAIAAPVIATLMNLAGANGESNPTAMAGLLLWLIEL